MQDACQSISTMRMNNIYIYISEMIMVRNSESEHDRDGGNHLDRSQFRRKGISKPESSRCPESRSCYWNCSMSKGSWVEVGPHPLPRPHTAFAIQPHRDQKDYGKTLDNFREQPLPQPQLSHLHNLPIEEFDFQPPLASGGTSLMDDPLAVVAERERSSSVLP